MKSGVFEDLFFGGCVVWILLFIIMIIIVLIIIFVIRNKITKNQSLRKGMVMVILMNWIDVVK